MLKIMAVGEVMVELAQVPGENTDLRRLNFAGDTFNTAVYLARLGVSVGYCTRLGDDPLSERIRAMMALEGIDQSMVETVPGRAPGLYMITNSVTGERTFSYWRGQSPARELFSDSARTQEFSRLIEAIPYLYLSGISLGILPPETLTRLFDVLAAYRQQGGQVVFDSNYRPLLWRDRAAAQAAISQAMSHTDIALLTDTDELLLWGSDDPSEIMNRCQTLGVSELVIKRGSQSVYLALRGEVGALLESQQLPVPPVPKVVDTTAAGDSFNAAYLATRLQGGNPVDAVRRGIRCASVVIQHPGAIIDPKHMQDL